jgi:hypothetical protein
MSSLIQYSTVIQGGQDPIYAYIYNQAPSGSDTASYKAFATYPYGTPYSYTGTKIADGGASYVTLPFTFDSSQVAPARDIPISITGINTATGDFLTQSGTVTVLAHAAPALLALPGGEFAGLLSVQRGSARIIARDLGIRTVRLHVLRDLLCGSAEATFAHETERLDREVGIHRAGAVTDQQAEVMHLARLAGFGHDQVEHPARGSLDEVGSGTLFSRRLPGRNGKARPDKGGGCTCGQKKNISAVDERHDALLMKHEARRTQSAADKWPSNAVIV